jgi:hypothetical protein
MNQVGGVALTRGIWVCHSLCQCDGGHRLQREKRRHWRSQWHTNRLTMCSHGGRPRRGWSRLPVFRRPESRLRQASFDRPSIISRDRAQHVCGCATQVDLRSTWATREQARREQARRASKCEPKQERPLQAHAIGDVVFTIRRGRTCKNGVLECFRWMALTCKTASGPPASDPRIEPG